MKKIFFASKISAVTFMFAFASVVSAATWAGPQSAPTGGNIEPPVNTSSNNQIKTGSLGVGTGLVLGNLSGILVAARNVVSYGSVFGQGNIIAGVNALIGDYAGANTSGRVAADAYCFSAANGGCITSWAQAGSGGGTGNGISVTGTLGHGANGAVSFAGINNLEFSSPDFTISSPGAGHIIVNGGGGSGTLPTGTQYQTLYNDGSTWLNNSIFTIHPFAGVFNNTLKANGVLAVVNDGTTTYNNNGGNPSTLELDQGLGAATMVGINTTSNSGFKFTRSGNIPATVATGSIAAAGDIQAATGFLASYLTGHANEVLCVNNVNKIVACAVQPGAGGAAIQGGTLNHTVRFDGTNWVDSGNLQDESSTDGRVTVGNGAPLDKWDRLHVMGGGLHIDRNASDVLFLNNNNADATQGVAVISNRDFVHFWSDVQGTDHSSDIMVRDVKAGRDGYFGSLANNYNYAVCADAQGKLILCSGGGNGNLVVDVKVNGIDAYVHDVGDVTGNTGFAANHTVTVSWTVTGVGVTSCTASGNWSGSKNTTSGSEQVTLNIYGRAHFTLDCASAVANGTDTATADISGFVKYLASATSSFNPSSFPAFANVDQVTVTAVGQGGSGGILSNQHQVAQFCVPQNASGGADGAPTTITYNGVTVSADGGHHAVPTGGAGLSNGAPGNGSSANGATVIPGSGTNPGVTLQFGNFVGGLGGYAGQSTNQPCTISSQFIVQHGGGGSAVTKTWAYSGGPITWVAGNTNNVGTAGAVKIAW